ncbi:MAG: HAD hydrolase family protein, partial [Candidatus Hydrothermarchaeales archaeon]
ETVHRLISMGHRTAIITDSYDVAAEYFKEKLGMDKAVGNRLIIEGGRITGSLEMPRNCPTEEKCDYPSVCKKEIMKAMCSEFRIPLSETVAIGDNKIDICMLKEAGVGIAFNPKAKELEDAADVVIKGEDLREVLRYVNSE